MLFAIASQSGVAYNNIKLIENIKEAKTFNDNIMQSIVTGVFTTNLMGPPSLVAAHSAQPRLGLRPADIELFSFYWCAI